MRGKGEGSIYKRSDGLWVAAIELPSINGGRRRKVITSKDKRQVIKKLNDLGEELKKRGDLPTDGQTVDQWFTYWLDVQRKEIRPKTWTNYESMVRNHVIPTIGKVRLDKLTAAHLRRVYDGMAKKNLSSTSALAAHRILSASFTDAEREGRIRRNPAKNLDAPRRQTTALEVLTVAEAVALVQRAHTSADGVLWATFLLTGARRGELLGLTWDRVSDVLDLSWQLQRHTNMTAPADYEYRQLHGGLYLTRPKSKAGWRIIPLVEPLASILAGWQSVAPTNAHNLIFATSDGTPRDPDNVSKSWVRAVKAAGIGKHVRLHDLRHTTVDLLYEAGVDEATIVEIVGHSTRAQTRSYKSRGNRPQLTDAMNKMSALLTTSGGTAAIEE